MKFVEKIDEAIFDQFVRQHPHSHYMKSPYWGKYKQKTENYRYYCVGVMVDDQLVATALVLDKMQLGFGRYFYIPWGPCVDYHNKQLVSFLIEGIKKMAAAANVFMIRMDPNVIRVSRDIKGNQVDGINNEAVTDFLQSIGFRHKGYGYAYNGSWVNRYTLAVDLTGSETEIFKRFNKNKQSLLRRQQRLGYRSYKGTQENIKQLCQFEKDLSVIHHFKPHSHRFFSTILNSFPQDANIYVTEVDFKKCAHEIQEELNSGKYRNDQEALQKKEKELQQYQQLAQQHSNPLVVSTGLFIKYGTKSYDLYMYNDKDFPFLKATDNTHWHVIRDMKQRGVTFYDMVGFSGVTDRSDPFYGLYDFKKSFGSEFIEYIGEFDYVYDEKKYERFKKYYRLKNRITLKLNRMIYK